MFCTLLAVFLVPSRTGGRQYTIVPRLPLSAVELHARLDISYLWTDPAQWIATWETEDPSPSSDSQTEEDEDVPEPPPFQGIILKAAQNYDVDAALIRAIIMAESNNNPSAVSQRGARGLMQLMPTTAKWLGVDDCFNPALNIDGGVRYFKQLLDRFGGDIRLALAAYNAGSRYVRKYNGVPPFRATRVYIEKVLHYHQQFINEMAVNQLGSSAV
jgi:soluble lytic murein transglycosylase-like protein